MDYTKNSLNMAASNPSSRAYFEQQREALMGEIAMVTTKAPQCTHSQLRIAY